MECSTALTAGTHLGDLPVLSGCLLVDGLVGEAREGRLDVVPLAQLEVLAEVLVTAPPVQVDHVQSLVTTHLMEVRVTNIVLDTVSRESTIASHLTVGLVDLTNSPAPVTDHVLLLVLDHDVEEEATPKMEDSEAPKETDTVLSVERLHFPVDVAEGVFEEAGEVLEGSPALGIVPRLLGLVHKLAEVTICVLCKGSARKSIS